MSNKIIHINRHFIAANAKDGANRPVYTIKDKGEIIYAQEVVINGPSRLVYNGTQLSCGARAWIETEAECDYIGRTTYHDAVSV